MVFVVPVAGSATGPAGTAGLCHWQRVPRIPWHSVQL